MFNEQLYKNMGKMIDDFIYNKEPNTNKHMVNYIGTLNYVLEYNTLTIGVPRQTGKTTLICERFIPYSDMIITINKRMADHLKYELALSHDSNVYSEYELYGECTMGRYFAPRRIIWLDEILKLDLNVLSRLILCGLVGENTKIIGLGTLK